MDIKIEKGIEIPEKSFVKPLSEDGQALTNAIGNMETGDSFQLDGDEKKLTNKVRHAAKRVNAKVACRAVLNEAGEKVGIRVWRV